MAKRKQKRAADNGEYKTLVRYLAAIALIALGLILALADFALAGAAGATLFAETWGAIGVGAFLLPIAVIAGGLMLMLEQAFVTPLETLGWLLVIVAALAFFGIALPAWGGIAGTAIGLAAAHSFGTLGALVLIIAGALIGLVLATDFIKLLERLGAGALQATSAAGSAIGTMRLPSMGGSDEPMEEEYEQRAPEPEPAPEEQQRDLTPEREPTINVFNRAQEASGAAAAVGGIRNYDAEYDPPPLSILGEDKGKPGTGDIKANANVIRRTFQNFGINVEMDEVSVGPTVTRYAVKPAEGVRLSKIVSLQSNLELALAAHPVRIEAPIPGKSLVGIEVPNAAKAMVGLGGLLNAPEWNASKKPLLAAIGRDITGTPHYVNVAKMPHGLVAGATGSGKSVAIHALITSLLYRNGPNQMRFIMIDPKRVELTLYNGIPHLLTPVITDPKKTIMALKWAAKEMDRRYGILETEQVRDIDSYHSSVYEPAKKKGGDNLPESMPYIVIVVDELADIMQTYPRELEAAIVRLAQMSRAVGIHLVLSTQRPSVNVITGLIKANVPTRMALQVASQIDSRTILDGAGAEQLLGAGDMLYLSSDMQKPVRIQTAFISENEVKKVAQYIKTHNAGDLSSLSLDGAAAAANDGMGGPNDAISMALEDDEVDDDLYANAKAAVEEAGRASTSYLQRKLRIGYSRAARLMDLLEQKGVIGAADGSKPREVLSRSGGGAAVPADEGEQHDF
jgi:S-DNA-T family DNA segregation ATPase FtsK/SpoIIIE